MADSLTWEERWKRDGGRWRYIYLLENELERRKTRQAFIYISGALNLVMAATLIWLLK